MQETTHPVLLDPRILPRLKWLRLQTLYPLLDVVSQLTRLRNKIFQYSSILSVRTFVRTVQGLVMQVGNA